MTIRNDATRATIRPKDGRRPRSVVARQGQVLLDADLDQQSRHLLDRVETETGDVLGSPGLARCPGHLDRLPDHGGGHPERLWHRDRSRLSGRLARGEHDD